MQGLRDLRQRLQGSGYEDQPVLTEFFNFTMRNELNVSAMEEPELEESLTEFRALHDQMEKDVLQLTEWYEAEQVDDYDPDLAQEHADRFASIQERYQSLEKGLVDRLALN